MQNVKLIISNQKCLSQKGGNNGIASARVFDGAVEQKRANVHSKAIVKSYGLGMVVSLQGMVNIWNKFETFGAKDDP